MSQKKYPIISPHPPVIHTSIVSGKRYIVGGGDWLELPDEATEENLHKWMIWRQKAPKPKAPPAQYWKVEGSKGKVYTVSFAEHRWSCECHGFKFRRDCKHIHNQKKYLK
jgi:hypothetical protein